LEYIGGNADPSGFVRLDNYVMDSYWNSYYYPEGLGSEDSFHLVIALDTVEPVIDTAATGIVFDKTDSTGSLILKVTDNTVYMDAGIEIFTYSSGVRLTVWDTVTQSLNSGTRTYTDPNMNTTVICTLDFSEKVKAYFNQIDTNGLYCALYVSDGHKKYFYHSYPVEHDSLTGTFPSLSGNWKIVNITGSPDMVSDMVSNLVTFKGIYDRDRYRLYGLSETAFVEYQQGDAGFNILPGRAFMMITRYTDDDNVRFKTNSATSAYLKGDRGFITANGGNAGRWQLVTLPFMGTVKKSAIVGASITIPDSSRVTLGNRIWQYNPFIKIYENTHDAYTFKSVQGFSEGFLVYLYAGDTLIIPVTDNAEYLNAGKPAAAKSLLASDDWKLTLSLSSIGYGGEKIIDNFNSFGMVSNHYGTLPDLVMPGAGYQVGFLKNDRLVCLDLRKNNAMGDTWDVYVKNRSGRAGDLIIELPDIHLLPSQYLIYLDNPQLGYMVDLREFGGRYAFYCEANEEKRFKIIVGNGTYIMDHYSAVLPARFSVRSNYPNPFNPSTIIRFDIPANNGKTHVLKPEHEKMTKVNVSITIYDIQGQLVRNITLNDLKPGFHRILWDSRDNTGENISAGIYLCRVKAGRFSGQIKMVCVK
jgi:hypothetical protein